MSLKGMIGAADLAGVTIRGRRTAALAASLALVVALVTPALGAGQDLDFEGGGWGHGIGMSQYGALGQALDGKTAEEIVGYYYEGSSTAPLVDQVGAQSFLVSDPSPLWVNLLASTTIFEFEAVDGPLTVCQSGSGGCAYTANPGEAWRFITVGNGLCRFRADGEAVTAPGSCSATVKGMSPGGAKVRMTALDDGRDTFARGKVRVRTATSGQNFHVSLEINLEDYLYGLAEVPFSWPAEALRAQALAGRSYAAWRMLSYGPEAELSAVRQGQCWCQLYATTVDQSYKGWAMETAASSGDWRAAVDDTSTVVITHPDASQSGVVAAFYSSSTGGATENNEDIWGGGPVSYLRSQPDPWSQDPAVNNPFDTWIFSFSEEELAAKFGVTKVDGVEIVERFDSGTPSLVNIYTRTGGATSVIAKSGAELFSILDLRSRQLRELQYGQITAVGGDYDGDGRSDVAMMLDFNSSWWVGTADSGEFDMSPWQNHTNNVAWSNRVSGDFNGDGRSDVALVQTDAAKLRVGISDGTEFDFSVWADHANPEFWGPVIVGDFDGNGSDDLAEYDNLHERWRVYRLVDGQPAKETWYDFSVSDPAWSDHVVGDYDGNGFDDILSVDSATGDLIVLFSNGTGLTPSPWQSLPNDGAWSFVQSGDYDGDGRDDLAAFDPVTATWWITRGSAGTGGQAPVAWYTFSDASQDWGAQVTGDFNNDGKSDIAGYNRANGKLKVLTSSGEGFDKLVWAKISAKDRVTQVIPLDVNADGLTDLGAWDPIRRKWWVARSTGEAFKVSGWGRLLR